MMNKVFFIIAILFSGYGFSQSDLIKAVESAVSSGNNSAAIQSAEKAITAIKQNPVGTSPEDLATLYYNYGQALKANGNFNKALDAWGKVNDLETKPYYVAKNKDTKKNEYFMDKAKGESAVASGNYSKLKEKKADPKYSNLLNASMNELLNTNYKKASDQYGAKDFSNASKSFEETFGISKAMGIPNYVSLYYAAVAADQATESERALMLYRKVKDSGYDGVETRYYMTNKTTGKEEEIPEAQLGIVKLDSNYANLREEQTESIVRNLDLGILRSLFNLSKYDPIVETIKADYPADKDVLNFVRNIYVKSKRMDKLEEILKKKVQTNPTAQDYADLGSISIDNEKFEEAKSYFKKAIDLNPDDFNVVQTVAYVIMQPDKGYVDILNNLGDSAEDQKLRKEYGAKRELIYKEALPFFERAHELQPENREIVHDLRLVYKELDMREKAREMLQKEKSLGQ